MRTVTLTLRDSTGRLEASETTGCASDYQPTGVYLRQILEDLGKRLDVLEREGPWKNDVVQNSLTPPPLEQIIAAAEPKHL